jgi:hypothetical protein
VLALMIVCVSDAFRWNISLPSALQKPFFE